jgi:hypothetical protein
MHYWDNVRSIARQYQLNKEEAKHAADQAADDAEETTTEDAQ